MQNAVTYYSRHLDDFLQLNGYLVQWVVRLNYLLSSGEGNPMRSEGDAGFNILHDDICVDTVYHRV